MGIWGHGKPWSPSREPVTFGIEIELTGNPRDVDVSPSNKMDYKRAGFRKLQSALEVEKIKTRMDPVNSDGRFRKYPEDYDQWNLQQDSSIEPRDEYTASMFSPKLLNTRSYIF